MLHEVVMSRRYCKLFLDLLHKELAELRREEPRDYRAIAKVRILIIKARNELYPDGDPYKFFRDRKREKLEQLEDQESKE